MRGSFCASGCNLSQVPSVEQSSTMTICCTSRCAKTVWMTLPTVAASLNTGITTERHGSMSALDLISVIACRGKLAKIPKMFNPQM